jgi:hypothetical protein
MRSDSVDDAAAEARARVGGGAAREMSVTCELDGQEVRPRVEADDELGTLSLDRICDPIGENARAYRGLGSHD